MPPTPSQIRELLLKSTDKDANVVDMGNVVKAITHLESIHITREALEETRLGKTVNDIRKKTSNKELATRCKSLVKQWNKQFVRGAQKKDSGTPGTPSSGGTDGSQGGSQGGRPPSRGGQTPSVDKSRLQTGRPPSRGLQTPTSSVDKSRIENRKRRKPGSPGSAATSPNAELHPAKRSGQVSSVSTDSSINGLQGQATTTNSTKSAFAKVTPKMPTLSPRVSPRASSRTSPRVSPRDSTKTKTRKAAVKAVAGESSGRDSPSVQGEKSSSSSPVVASRTAQSKTDSPNVPMPKLDKMSDSLVNQTSAKNFTPEKTTSSMGNAKSKVDSSKRNSTLGTWSPSVQPNSTKLDDDNSSAATVKLRATSPTASSPSLQSQSSKTSSISTLKKDNSSSSSPLQIVPKPRMESSKPALKSVKSIFDDDSSDEDDYSAKVSDPVNSFSLASPTSNTPEIDSDENSTDPKPLPKNNGSESHVPEISSTSQESSKSVTTKMMETLEDDVEEEEVIIRKPVTQDDVNRLHDDRWEGVNGCYDNDGQWFDWTQCLSVLFNQEEHPLHILPYVTLD